MSVPGGKPHSLDELPKAKLERNWKTYFIWLVPLAAAALAGWFIYSNMVKGGPTLHILFEDAAGLQPGKSQLKYRGAEIGEVRDLPYVRFESEGDRAQLDSRGVVFLSRGRAAGAIRLRARRNGRT